MNGTGSVSWPVAHTGVSGIKPSHSYIFVCMLLFVYGLFNDALISSDCSSTNNRMINE
jgi:hypothetical protein